MKQLVILSGKGGTGKTSVTAALAHLASEELPIVLADGDVDAANLELVLEPARMEEHVFMGGQVAAIDPDLCQLCGRCHEVCRSNAIKPTVPVMGRAIFFVNNIFKRLRLPSA